MFVIEDVPRSSGISKMQRSMASMSELLAYAMVMWVCAICRVRALHLWRLSAAGAFADVHRYFQRIWHCVQKNTISWLDHRSPVLTCIESLVAKKFACVMQHNTSEVLRITYAPLIW
jgi:hypothetical protein